VTEKPANWRALSRTYTHHYRRVRTCEFLYDISRWLCQAIPQVGGGGRIMVIVKDAEAESHLAV
jgi:hypothetical protein